MASSEPDPADWLARGLSRETRLRRDRDGRWWDGDRRVEHPGVARAFDAWIDRAPDGRYCLRNAIHWVYVTVEGAPIDVRAVHPQPDGSFLLTLSDGRHEPLDPATLRLDGDGALWCDVRGGSMPARFDRHAMVGLEPWLEDSDGGPVLRLGSRRLALTVVDDPHRVRAGET
ncbi:MAG: DUF1285 domain-containing protein [Myxococcales bacterium]|nr:DUF1285 domain-containing protein [Myxococcales bacterium]